MHADIGAHFDELAHNHLRGAVTGVNHIFAVGSPKQKHLRSGNRLTSKAITEYLALGLSATKNYKDQKSGFAWKWTLVAQTSDEELEQSNLPIQFPHRVSPALGLP